MFVRIDDTIYINSDEIMWYDHVKSGSGQKVTLHLRGDHGNTGREVAAFHIDSFIEDVRRIDRATPQNGRPVGFSGSDR